LTQKPEIMENEELDKSAALPAPQGAAATAAPAAAPAMEPAAPAAQNPVLAFVERDNPEMASASDEEKFAYAAQLLEKQLAFAERMEKLFDEQPEVASLIAAALNGEEDIAGAIAKIISPEELEAIIGASGDDAKAAAGERRTRFKQFTDDQDRVSENVNANSKVLADFARSKGMSEEEETDFADKLNGLLGMLVDGKITPDEAQRMYDMLYLDKTVSAKYDEGLLAGRNEKIDASRIENEVRKGGDGLPKLSGAGTPPVQEEDPNAAKTKNFFSYNR
jgi:hypothetical protein